MLLPKFEEQMIVSYEDMIGSIVCITKHYFTFMPNNTNALILVYRENWNAVTVL